MRSAYRLTEPADVNAAREQLTRETDELPDPLPDLCACSHDLSWHDWNGFCGQCTCASFVLHPEVDVA
jgi:hypothetical protein